MNHAGEESENSQILTETTIIQVSWGFFYALLLFSLTVLFAMLQITFYSELIAVAASRIPRNEDAGRVGKKKGEKH